MATFIHKGSLGDLNYSLPAIKSYSNEKHILCFKHKEHLDTLKSLFELQNINPVLYTNQKIDVNLNEFRKIHKKDPCKLLPLCHLEVVNKTFDLSKPWLYNIDSKPIAEIVVNYTPRYHNNIIEFNWMALKPFISKCIFIGHDKDYEYFKRSYNLDIKRVIVKDGLEIAQIIKGSKVFCANQSMCYSIAFGLQHNRVLERFKEKDNCYLKTENSYDYLDEELILKYLN